MNPLQSELHRLYLVRPAPAALAGAPPPGLADAAGQVRCMVLELSGPPSWPALSKVWQGVQAELDMPAPAIAVSGTDGLQLWFSLAEAIAAAAAHGFLDRLRQRYLPDIDPGRVRLLPAADATAAHPERHAAPVPALQPGTGNWSAFLAADLIAVFADTPWLDVAPGEEGQAALLRELQTTTPAVFDAARRRLDSDLMPRPAGDDGEADGADPRRFLLQVMRDTSVALALRIDAAKALLRSDDQRRDRDG